MRLTCTVIAFGILALALLLPACKQGEGDRCNWNDDCAEGLVCCVTPENRVLGGVCVFPLQCDLTAQDGGLVFPDSGPDAKVTPADGKPTVDLKLDQALISDQSTDTAPKPDVILPGDISPAADQPLPDSSAE